MNRSLLILLAAVATPALADPTVAVVPGEIEEIKTLEEVVVTGERSLSSARIAIIDAEDRFYARWNELNDDRRFDIQCRMETPRDHHSRIVRRVCQPAFLEDMQQAVSDLAMRDIQGGMSTAGKTVMVSGTGASKMLLQEELRRRTMEMLRKDPELLGALLQRARLEQHYEELRKEKFKDRWIFWK